MRKAFGEALRRTARELDLPPRARAEILLELAADLEAAYEARRREGVPEAEAAREAEDRILGPPKLMRRLARLHAGGSAARLGALRARLVRGTGLVLVALAVLPLLALAGRAGGAALLSAPATPGTLTILLAGGAILVIAAGEGERLLRGGMPRPDRLAELLVLSVAAPALGGLIAALGVYSGATELVAGAAAPPATGVDGLSGAGRMPWLVHAGGNLVIGLLFGVAGALAWSVLGEGASRRADRETASLLEDGAAPDGHDVQVIPFERRRA